MDRNSSDQSIDVVLGCVKGVDRRNAESTPICRPFRLEIFRFRNTQGLQRGKGRGRCVPRQLATPLAGNAHAPPRQNNRYHMYA